MGPYEGTHDLAFARPADAGLVLEKSGERYESVNIEFVKELVKNALIDAEKSLNMASSRRT